MRGAVPGKSGHIRHRAEPARAAGAGARAWRDVTLSSNQHAAVRRRADDAGLGDLVDVRLQDYRDVPGQYDAVVSVEMIEAVGREHWPAYFGALRRLTASPAARLRRPRRGASFRARGRTSRYRAAAAEPADPAAGGSRRTSALHARTGAYQPHIGRRGTTARGSQRPDHTRRGACRSARRRRGPGRDPAHRLRRLAGSDRAARAAAPVRRAGARRAAAHSGDDHGPATGSAAGPESGCRAAARTRRTR
jgi:mycolic acid cyclopropane synthetase